MSLPKFIYFIVEEDGRTRQVVNGVVTSLNTPRMLPNAPDGNQEISIGWERSTIYYGNVRNFSLKLGFVRDGLQILRNDFYQFNADRKLYLLIKRYTFEINQTANTFKEYYKQFYKGQFDFSTSEDNQGDYKFEANLLEGGLQRLFKAAESTKYFIPFDGDAKNLKMDGMFITGNFRWLVPDNFTDGVVYPGMYQLNNDNPIPGLAIFDVQRFLAGGDPDENSLQYFAEATQDIAGAVLTGTIVNITYGFQALNIELVIFNTISNTVRLSIDLTPNDPYPQGTNLVVNETFNMLAGDRLFLKTGIAPDAVIDFKESTLQISAKSKPLQSYIKGFQIYDLWRKITEKVTGNADDFQSTLLPNVNIILTSGDGVRGIPGAGITTSLKDLWDATNVYIMGGLQITDKIRIEGRSAFFAPESVTPAIELGEVKNFRSSYAEEFFGTNIKVGHAEQQVDDTNGKFDFAGYQVYTTPIKGIAAREINLQSPYKASPWEIEQTRANFEGKTTTDKSTDNDVYAIAAKPDDVSNNFTTLANFSADGTPITPGQPLLNIVAANPRIQAGMKLRITGSALNNADFTVKDATPWFFGQLIVTNEALVDESGANITIEILQGKYYALDRETSVTQLMDPDVDQEIKDNVFNVPLSPKRILQTHFPWLAGVFSGYAPESLIFESENRNREMIAGGIVEKADVPIASMGLPMFLPKWFEFDNVVPYNLPEVHETNPTPVYGFFWKGRRYTGFQWKDAFAASTLEEQTFKLLACPDNDLLTLI